MTEHDGRTFDRVEQFDERSRAFPIRMIVGTLLAPRSYTWSCQPHLDQGDVGACVGFGWAHELAARPAAVPNVTDARALAIYEDACIRDGEDWPEGTSVLAGAQTIRARGWINEFRWAFGLADVLATLSYLGPVVLGVDWLDSMMEPPPTGILDCSGQVVGGHCILANGISKTRKLVRLHQSWGLDWGIFGDAFISWDDLDHLLKAGGEACIPIHRNMTGTWPKEVRADVAGFDAKIDRALREAQT